MRRGAQAQSWRLPALEQALNMIMTAEFKCKQTGSAPALILSRLLLSLAQMGAAGRRRA